MHKFQQNQSYQLFRIDIDAYQDVMKFIYCNYTKNQPLSIYLNITNDQFTNIYKTLIFNACKAGLSFGYKYKNQIVAITLAALYEDYIIPIQSTPNYQPLQALFCQIQQAFFPQKWQKTIYLSFACTVPQHRNRGLFRQIVQNIQQNGKKEGFYQYMADCTNSKSENVLIKLEYKVKARLFYKNFQYKGGIPFQNLQTTDSISMLYKKLKKNRVNELLKIKDR